MSTSAILAKIEPFRVKNVLLTGGEPLLQRQTLELVKLLNEFQYSVSIETHGEHSIESFARHARIIMDIKTPSSLMSRGGFRENLKWLKPEDEIKFVIASKQDYQWSKEIVQSGELPSQCEILFSPVVAANSSPQPLASLEPQWLAEQILKDHLPVRMQLQMHKLIWGKERTGV